MRFMLIAALLLAAQGVSANEAVRVNGTVGIACSSPEAVEAFAQETALMSDAQLDALDVRAATKEQCFVVIFSGMLTGVVHTFTRRDNRIVEVLQYTPRRAIGMVLLYTFSVLPSDGAAGL